ncbi:MAG: hypothetical protein ACLFS5_00120 [Spirochaetaceae bacterium]
MSTTARKKVLFVCTANQQRSPTAEHLYSDDPRFEARSAGTHTLANRQVSRDLVRWADLIVVMEEHHARTIRAAFRGELRNTPMLVLGIPDVYQYMEPALQREIRERFEAALP